MMDKNKVKELKKFAAQIRIETLKELAELGAGHVGGSLDLADLMAVLYGAAMKIDPKNPTWAERDYFVLSKGHAGPAVYATLALKGFFPIEMLATLNKPHTNLPSHCDRLKTPGVDMTTGSLGQGSSAAYGIAFANKVDKKPNYTYLILGDGELNEGQVWEVVQLAPHNNVNLIAVVDNNKQQIDGFTCEVCDLGDLSKKFAEFGWFTVDVDGHDVEAIYDAIQQCKAAGKPGFINLHTIKGKGWKAVEGKLNNHNIANIKWEDVKDALADLEAEVKSLS